MLKKIVYILLIMLIFISCDLAENEVDYKKVNITDVGWIIDNIDKSYWTSGTAEATLFHQLSMSYSGDDVSLSDIEYARVYYGYIYWTFPVNEDGIDVENKHIYPQEFHTKGYSENGSVIPIGNFVFKIKLKNGYETKYNFDMPLPGSTLTGGYDRIYNEDYMGEKTSSYIQTLKRASVEDCVINQTEKVATVNFVVNDDMAYSGYLWLYTSDDSYIGKVAYFKDYKTGENSPVLNEASGLNVDGTNNEVKFEDTNIYYQDGYSFSDIKKVVVVLTDGRQHDGSDSTYDSRSVSTRKLFTEN